MTGQIIPENQIKNETTERDKEIVRLAKSGMSYTEIGRKVSLTRARVSQICIKGGFRRMPN